MSDRVPLHPGSIHAPAPFLRRGRVPLAASVLVLVFPRCQLPPTSGCSSRLALTRRRLGNEPLKPLSHPLLHDARQGGAVSFTRLPFNVRQSTTITSLRLSTRSAGKALCRAGALRCWQIFYSFTSINFPSLSSEYHVPSLIPSSPT